MMITLEVNLFEEACDVHSEGLFEYPHQPLNVIIKFYDIQLPQLQDLLNKINDYQNEMNWHHLTLKGAAYKCFIFLANLPPFNIKTLNLQTNFGETWDENVLKQDYFTIKSVYSHLESLQIVFSYRSQDFINKSSSFIDELLEKTPNLRKFNLECHYSTYIPFPAALAKQSLHDLKLSRVSLKGNSIEHLKSCLESSEDIYTLSITGCELDVDFEYQSFLSLFPVLSTRVNLSLFEFSSPHYEGSNYVNIFHYVSKALLEAQSNYLPEAIFLDITNPYEYQDPQYLIELIQCKKIRAISLRGWFDDHYFTEGQREKKNKREAAAKAILSALISRFEFDAENPETLRALRLGSISGLKYLRDEEMRLANAIKNSQLLAIQFDQPNPHARSLSSNELLWQALRHAKSLISILCNHFCGSQWPVENKLNEQEFRSIALGGPPLAQVTQWQREAIVLPLERGDSENRSVVISDKLRIDTLKAYFATHYRKEKYFKENKFIFTRYINQTFFNNRLFDRNIIKTIFDLGAKPG